MDDIVWGDDACDDTLTEAKLQSGDLSRTCQACGAALLAAARFCGECGSPAIDGMTAPRADPLAGTQDLLPPRYRIRKLLGRGARGRVFLCRDRDLAVDVAVKVLLPELLAEPRYVERMRDEARAAAKFRECPGILSLYGFDRYKDSNYLVMEYAAGGSLHQRLRREHRLSEPECRRLGAEVAKALGYAHRHQVVHRDIKPANVLLDSRWRAKVADFGIASVLAEAATAHTGEGLVGTPAYVAPEIMAGEPVDARADLYSLGCMLFEMATGQLPFKGSFPEIALAKVSPTARPPDPAAVRPGLSASFARVIRCLLSRNPEDRYLDAVRCAVALDSAAVSLELTPTVEANLAETRNATLARALFRGAIREQEQGNFATAGGLLERALALHEELFGAQDPLVARDLKYIARNEYLQGRHEAAEAPFARSLRIRQKALGANHPDIASDLTFMGRLYTLQGKHEQARMVYARALGIMEQSVGTRDPALVRLLNHLAMGHLEKGRPDDAGRYLQRALKIAEAVKGRGHPAVARTLNSLAALHLRLGDCRRSESILNRALTILELAHGPAHASLLDTLDLLAAVLERLRKPESAARMRQRAAAIRAAAG